MFLPAIRFMMASYAATYGCAGSNAEHTCHSCPEARVREFARIRSGGWCTTAYLATLLAGINDPAVWQTGMDDGEIIMLPETSGSYDPGEPKELKGFGDRKVTYGPREMKVLINDPDYADNYAFYNEIISRTDLVPFFRTSGLVHIFDVAASVKAKNPVADDLEEEVIWTVESSITSVNLPTMHSITPIASVFACANF